MSGWDEEGAQVRLGEYSMSVHEERRMPSVNDQIGSAEEDVGPAARDLEKSTGTAVAYQS